MFQRQLLISDVQKTVLGMLKPFKMAGCVQIALGLFLTIVNIGLVLVRIDPETETYSGLWTGPFFFAAGSLAIAVTRVDAKMFFFIFGSMLLSVLSAFLAAAAIGVNFSTGLRFFGFIIPYDMMSHIVFGLEILTAIVQVVLGFKLYCSVSGAGQQRQLDGNFDTVQSAAVASPA